MKPGSREPIGEVVFEVVFEDGRVATMTVDRGTPRTGDHVAKFVAAELQACGRLPPGQIWKIRRAAER
jgi:hypothetical protein